MLKINEAFFLGHGVERWLDFSASLYLSVT